MNSENHSGGKLSSTKGQFFLVSAAVLVMFLLGGYVTLFIQCSRTSQTGNPLFDRYAQEVARRAAPRLFFTGIMEGVPNPAHLPDEILDQWEPEFGSEPDYWELRCWNANSTHFPYLAQGGPLEWGIGTEFLQRARELGVADANTLQLLYLKRKGEWESSRTTRDQEAAVEMPKEVSALLDETIESFPESAWPNYRRAVLNLQDGEMAAALNDLRSGTKAVQNAATDIFPMDFLKSWIASNPEQVPANRQVAASVLNGWQGGMLEDWFPVKRAWQAIQQETDSALKRELNSEFIRASARMGSVLRDRTYEAGICCSYIRGTAKRLLLSEGDSLNQQQRMMTLWLYSRAGDIGDGLSSWELSDEENRSGLCNPAAVFWLMTYFGFNQYDLQLSYDQRAVNLQRHAENPRQAIALLGLVDLTAEDFGLANYEEAVNGQNYLQSSGPMSFAGKHQTGLELSSVEDESEL